MPRSATAVSDFALSLPGGEPGAREPSPSEVRAQLARILAGRCFRRAGRSSRFLRFAVEETLAGRGDRLKGYSVALEVFDRPAGFDAQSDPLVRVEAGRLRRRVVEYYATEGSDDPVHIDFRRGSYAAVFSYSARGESREAGRAGDEPATGHGASKRRWRRTRAWLIASVLLAALAVIVAQQFQLSRVSANPQSSLDAGAAQRLAGPHTPADYEPNGWTADFDVAGIHAEVFEHHGASDETSMTSEIDEMRRAAAEVSDFLRSLSNENRLFVLCLLLEGEQSVGRLNAQIDLSPSALSQHLAGLREHGLVKTRREAQTIYYSLADERVSEVLAVLKKLFC